MRYMADLGLLNPWTTIAHSIWVTDDDIALMGDAGCLDRPQHHLEPEARRRHRPCPQAAPGRRQCRARLRRHLLQRYAAHVRRDACGGAIHKVTTPDYGRWLSASEVLHACTLAGARSALLDKETGSLEVGKKADLLVIDMNSVSFTPRNDIRNHLVYCEDGRSIEKVFVNGELVVESGRLTKVDEKALLAELQARMPEFDAYHRGVEAANRPFEPAFAEIHRRCNLMEVGVHRLATDESWGNAFLAPGPRP